MKVGEKIFTVCFCIFVVKRGREEAGGLRCDLMGGVRILYIYGGGDTIINSFKGEIYAENRDYCL